MLQRNLERLGFYKGSINGGYDEPTRKALRDFVNVNNFENRMHQDGFIWKSILQYMDDMAQKA